jgi:hypothetical protein
MELMESAYVWSGAKSAGYSTAGYHLTSQCTTPFPESKLDQR